MKTELKIAWRYLFAKKQFNAIHIITSISSAAVGVVTAAMICVLSVMNGFSVMVEQLFSHFDPDIRITAKVGKSFHLDNTKREQLSQLPCVDLLSESISEIALIEFDEKQMPVQLIGVDSNFAKLTNIEHIIKDGQYSVHDGAFDRTVLGRGLAWKLGIRAHFVNGIQVYAPKRKEEVHMRRPPGLDINYNRETCFLAGIFAVEQQKYDNNTMLVDIGLTRRLLDYDSTEITTLQVGIKDGYDIDKAKKRISGVMGNGFLVQDRYEQQEDFFKIFQIEKLLTTLLLAFILLIATFNGIGSLSMLIIDKRRLKLKDAGLPSVVLENTPKYLRWTKVPVVKAKVGPRVMTLMCDDKIFANIPIKKEVKAVVSGIYITEVKGIRGPLDTPKKKKGFFARFKKN